MSEDCKQYSNIAYCVFDAAKTTLAITSGEAKEHDVLFIHCTGCGWIDKCYSVKELDFFVGFNDPSICLFLCIACCRYVYTLVGSDEVQEQRVTCLFNNPNYWGVLDQNCAADIRNSFSRAGKCGYFLWEVLSALPFDPLQRVFIVAVTHVKYVTSELMRHESRDVDPSTYYIVFRQGRYHVTRRVRGSIRFKCPYGPMSFATLSEAINRAKDRRLAIDCRKPESSYCVCTEINRSTVLNTDRKVQSQVWSLQNICAFFIRNHSFHYQKECAQLYPVVLRNMIRDVRSVKLFRENVDCNE
jgi:hypothetical protein